MGKQITGQATDAKGRIAVDPSINVKALVKANAKHTKQMMAVTWSKHELEARYQREIARLRASYYKDLRKSEAHRVDAINSVQVAAVAAAAAVAETRATALAAQQTVTGETLRAQVATVAQASQVALDAKIGPLDAKINVLSQNMFEQQGRQGQTVESRDQSGLRALWIGLAVAAFVGINGLLLTILGIITTYMVFRPK